MINQETNAEHFQYLFDLQKSGKTNMFGAGPYLQDEFGLSRADAREIVTYWMTNYAQLAKEFNVEV